MGNLAELAKINSEQLMDGAGPALRAALARHQTESRSAPFNSFIAPVK
ncbi:hypothetical protein [Nocardia sp. NBC_01327]|nr:hypothetical protein OG326_41730 [Nocardia sp. NBC_01327]